MYILYTYIRDVFTVYATEKMKISEEMKMLIAILSKQLILPLFDTRWQDRYINE